MKKADLIIYAAVLLIAAASFLIWKTTHSIPGKQVTVTVDGREYARFSLDHDCKELIDGYAGGRLTLIISEGEVHVEDSTCPDLICVKHSPVSHAGETIICLPNRIVITVTSDETDEIDAISQLTPERMITV